MNQPKYTVIHHEVKKKFRISNDEYCLADSIDKLSNKVDFPWCCSEKKDLGKFIGVSERTVYRMIAKLAAAGIVESDGDGNLRSTPLWAQTVVYITTDKMAKKTAKLAEPHDKMADNKNINNNKNNISPVVDKFPYAELENHFATEYMRIWDTSAPRINYGQVRKLMAPLKVPVESVKLMLTNFLEDLRASDSQIKAAPDLGVFLSSKHFNRYLSRLPKVTKTVVAPKITYTPEQLRLRREGCKTCKGKGYLLTNGYYTTCTHE